MSCIEQLRIDDESLIKEFFHSLSEESLCRRFASACTNMPYDLLQKFVIIDYTKEIVILALTEVNGREKVIGLGQFILNEDSLTAEVAFIVSDEFQSKGIGTELLARLTYIAKKRGLLGFTAQVSVDNEPALCLIEKMGYHIQSKCIKGIYEMNLSFAHPRWGLFNENISISFDEDS